MRELHKKNMLIVEIGVLLLIIMTFVSYGVSVKSYIGTAILILCGLLVFVGYKYIKNDLATALMITVIPSVGTFAYAFVMGGNPITFLANYVFLAMMAMYFESTYVLYFAIPVGVLGLIFTIINPVVIAGTKESRTSAFMKVLFLAFTGAVLVNATKRCIPRGPPAAPARPPTGAGAVLYGLMCARETDLRGIVNGLDYNEWNPETDAQIAKNFNVKNFRKEKVKNKLALQEELGLEVNPKTMMIGIVSRLTDQKGFDLIAYIMDELCQDAVQIVALGTGEERYENMFRHFDWKYGDKVSANIYYSDALSHKIYAACDAYLMPSLFEPCGLSQLIALRYGTVPIVRETGGLKDTVQPYNEYESTGTGFSFTNYNAHEMLNTIRYAEHIYYDRKREWNKIVDRAMATDYSWKVSAGKYQEMYDWLIG